jgi:hypothetical protein
LIDKSNYSNFEITKAYANELKSRKIAFRTATKTKKMLLTTFITNEPIKENAYALETIDVVVELCDLMK